VREPTRSILSEVSPGLGPWSLQYPASRLVAEVGQTWAGVPKVMWGGAALLSWKGGGVSWLGRASQRESPAFKPRPGADAVGNLSTASFWTGGPLAARSSGSPRALALQP